MTSKSNPKISRNNSKTYKLTASPDLLQELNKLCLAHTLEMLHVPASSQGMPTIDAITASMGPLKSLLAGIASGKAVAGREVKPENINGVSLNLLVSAGYFVVEFSEVINDAHTNTIHRYGYRLSVTDETGLPLIRKLSIVHPDMSVDELVNHINKI